jgi:hypothetical protein
MELILTAEGFDEATAKLGLMDRITHEHMRRALYRIGGLWKKTAVQYAPISPSTTMLKKFAKQMKQGKAHANILRVKGRKGNLDFGVVLTRFYEYRLPMLIGKGSKNRPMPGGLMRSISVRNTDTQVECFVPTNSVAGSYAFKIHEEKGSKWKDRGPGTQAKGPQADEKFITRAAADKADDFAAMVKSEIDKILEGLK